MNYIWEFIINIFEALLFCLLLNQKLEQKEYKHLYPKQFAVLLLQSILLFILNQLGTSPFYTLLIFIILHYIFADIFFASSNILKIFWVIVYTVATVSADALTTIIPTKLLNYNINTLLQGGVLRIPFTIVYITLLAIIIIILLCFTTKIFRLSIHEKLVFIVLSIICLSIEELVLEQINVKHTGKPDLLYIIFFLVMLLFITLTFYIYALGIEKDKNIRMAELHMISEMENKQYSQIIQSVSELRVMKHDLTNHLKTIQAMLNTEHFSDAAQYIASLTGIIDKTYYSISSGNTPLDCIVTNKLKQAALSDIRVDYTIHFSNNFPLSDIEICSLIGNLFDNAIENCNKLKKDKRTIGFFIKPYNNMLSIQITNSYNGDYITTSKGFFITTKKHSEKHLHGIGLKRIHDIVKKYHGFLEVTPGEGTFQVSILIPLESVEEKTILSIGGANK